jgi:hypothetical protein
MIILFCFTVSVFVIVSPGMSCAVTTAARIWLFQNFLQRLRGLRGGCYLPCLHAPQVAFHVFGVPIFDFIFSDV